MTAPLARLECRGAADPTTPNISRSQPISRVANEPLAPQSPALSPARPEKRGASPYFLDAGQDQGENASLGCPIQSVVLGQAHLRGLAAAGHHGDGDAR